MNPIIVESEGSRFQTNTFCIRAILLFTFPLFVTVILQDAVASLVLVAFIAFLAWATVFGYWQQLLRRPAIRLLLRRFLVREGSQETLQQTVAPSNLLRFEFEGLTAVVEEALRRVDDLVRVMEDDKPTGASNTSRPIEPLLLFFQDLAESERNSDGDYALMLIRQKLPRALASLGLTVVEYETGRENFFSLDRVNYLDDGLTLRTLRPALLEGDVLRLKGYAELRAP